MVWLQKELKITIFVIFFCYRRDWYNSFYKKEFSRSNMTNLFVCGHGQLVTTIHIISSGRSVPWKLYTGGAASDEADRQAKTAGRPGSIGLSLYSQPDTPDQAGQHQRAACRAFSSCMLVVRKSSCYLCLLQGSEKVLLKNMFCEKNGIFFENTCYVRRFARRINSSLTCPSAPSSLKQNNQTG